MSSDAIDKNVKVKDGKPPNNPRNRNPRRPHFEGRHDKLKGYIFDNGNRKSIDRFPKSQKEVAEWMGQNCKHGGDIRDALLTLTHFAVPLPEPVNRTVVTDPDIANEIRKTRVQEYVKQENEYKQNCTKAYAIIWGQCSNHMQQQLEAHAGFGNIKRNSNPIDLLIAIRGLTYKFDGEKYLEMSLLQAIWNFHLFFQTRYMEERVFF
mmetsp:Transcript_39032/g.58635  ORF Transcript_39032/g.58635 Transcript_39032/m.58635 type:complete len:207 (-) Transcript_39032:729-1349(-)